MRYLRIITEAAVLATALFFSLATSWDTPYPDDDFFEEESETSAWDETWVVSNVFEGQTAVPTDHMIRLTVGYRDFLENPEAGEVTDAIEETAAQAMSAIELYSLDEYVKEFVDFQVLIFDEESFIFHETFEEDTTYYLDLRWMMTELQVDRITPGTITFSTMSAPKVTGVWQNDDTLIVSFSEPMNEETMTLAQSSVDVVWEADGDLHSLSADYNLADFVWDVEGYLFRLAPFHLAVEGWLMISEDAAGTSGVTLDGNGNGVPGEADDHYLQEYGFSNLPTCYARDDIPSPCIEDPEMGTF